MRKRIKVLLNSLVFVAFLKGYDSFSFHCSLAQFRCPNAAAAARRKKSEWNSKATGRTWSTLLHAASAPSGGNNNNGKKKKKKSLSASEQEQRREETRRRERADDVVIGKTSAQPGAKDYSLDPKSTERQWLMQASSVEQEIYVRTEEGMEMLKMLRIQEAADAFDHVFELKPNAYLWQAGIAKFYLGDVEGAADVFARSAATYESRFGEPASEERIWRHACELKLLNEMTRKDRALLEETGGLDSLLTPIRKQQQNDDSSGEVLRTENRKVIRITRDLFSASVGKDHTGVILSRAKLRSIGGTAGEQEERPRMDQKMWKLNSWYYLGLHYDSLGDTEESKKCMKMALRLCPSFGNGGDIIHTLPMLHMTCRDWFDDDDIQDKLAAPATTAALGTTTTGGPSLASTETGALPLSSSAGGADPLFVDSIKSSIAEMMLVELQDALRVKGLHTSGSKEELQGRFFQSLMDDIGLNP